MAQSSNNNFNKPKPAKAGSANNLPLPGLDQAATPAKVSVPAKTEVASSSTPNSNNSKPEKLAISGQSNANVTRLAPAKKPATPSAAILDFITHSIVQTQKAGEHLGQLLELGAVVLLEGDLGAGKTTLTKGIAAGLGVVGYVNSPTFTLVNEYRGRLPVYHLDCYRLESAAEALDFGIEEYLYGDGVSLIEWPQRIAEILPTEFLRIKLTYLADTKRSLRFEPVGAYYIELVTNFKKTAFGT
jgi:tRNA threonylcarbamoyladenosine biosynthesis protein TsaE